MHAYIYICIYIHISSAITNRMKRRSLEASVNGLPSWMWPLWWQHLSPTCHAAASGPQGRLCYTLSWQGEPLSCWAGLLLWAFWIYSSVIAFFFPISKQSKLSYLACTYLTHSWGVCDAVVGASLLPSSDNCVRKEGTPVVLGGHRRGVLASSDITILVKWAV